MRHSLKRALAWSILSIAMALLFLVFITCPIWRGYHFGCDPWEGGHQTERVWVGVRFCRQEAQ